MRHGPVPADAMLPPENLVRGVLRHLKHAACLNAQARCSDDSAATAWLSWGALDLAVGAAQFGGISRVVGNVRCGFSIRSGSAV